MDVLCHALESHGSTVRCPAEARRAGITAGLQRLEPDQRHLGDRARPARALVPPRRRPARRPRGARGDDAGRDIRGHRFRNAGVHLPHACAYPIAGLVRDYRAADYPARSRSSRTASRSWRQQRRRSASHTRRTRSGTRRPPAADRRPSRSRDRRLAGRHRRSLWRRRDPERTGHVRLWRGGRRPDRRGSAPAAATPGRQPAARDGEDLASIVRDRWSPDDRPTRSSAGWSDRPARSPVARPPLTAHALLTITRSIPEGRADGSASVARFPMVPGSNTTRSAARPERASPDP